MFWIDQQGRTVGDNDQYVSGDGTTYPWNFPKGDISGLTLVPPAPPAPPAPPPIPQVVSAAQFRCALTHMGLRQSVDGAVAASDQDTRDWYEFASVFERQNPRVLGMAMALNVSPSQLDTLWTLASTL